MQQREELELLKRRINVIGYTVVVILGVLGFGFWRHQVVESAYYGELADKNRIRNIPLLAPRGQIRDRNGKIYADNRPSYDIVLIRENSPHTVQQTAEMLAEGIDITGDELLQRINRKRFDPKFRPIVLKEDVSVGDIAFVKAHEYEMPEIRIELQPRRRYPGEDLAAHALGYVGEVTENQLATREFMDHKIGDQVGQSGLERTYNAVLRGKDGYRRVIVNKFGREMESLDQRDPIPGNDLYTTLDFDLQKAAEEAIGDRAGAAIAMDPRTGEVLVVASKPAFDPNLFATRISRADWNDLINDPRKPLQNRAIQNHYQPGSVFKVFMAAAGLEAGTLDPLDRVNCSGSAVHYGRAFACWKKGGHGVVGIHEAIVDSCNVFFYNVGEKLNIDRIAKYTGMMGLGRKTGVDLPNEDMGLIPSPEWKERVFKTKWYAGETISVAIGQGAVGLTPIQAAWAMGGLASGGRLKQPHMIQPERLRALGYEVTDVPTEEYPVHPETVDIVTKAMWGVVNEGGTGTKARVEGFDVAGKTGTAQVVGKQSYNKSSEETEDNAWFVGFAPYRNPEIVVAVFVEHGGHGGDAAAPVAHAIFETYYKKKTGQFDEEKVAKIVGLNN
jgi:penicillin-binding protein 2